MKKYLSDYKARYRYLSFIELALMNMFLIFALFK